MITPQAKEKYKQRAATIEAVAGRNRGCIYWCVIRKVEAILLWYALAHNLVQGICEQNDLLIGDNDRSG
jgi:hypothetical protein